MTTRRLYYDDSFEREFTAEVLSCRPAPIVSGASDSTPTWSVTLDRTAFYPTSGGQPHDRGNLGDAEVLDVQDNNDEIIHIISREVPLGAVKASIDWPRRFDHMQQHTGQHLLSAIFQERFGLPTVSFHLGAEICTIDLRGSEPSEEILESAVRIANEIVCENRPIQVRYGTAEEFARMGVRKQVERSGILRAIEIEGADLQPCGGTHVKFTGQIGPIFVRRCSKIRQDWRVEFVCGDRAVQLAQKDSVLLRRAAEKLSCATEEIVTTAERALAERDAHFKNMRAALQQLAEAEALLIIESTPTTSDGLRIISRVFQGVQPEFLGFFATELVKKEKIIALLARVDCGHIFFAQHPSAGKDMTALLKQVLERVGGKGGGPRDFARGKLNDGTQASKALEIAASLLRS